MPCRIPDPGRHLDAPSPLVLVLGERLRRKPVTLITSPVAHLRAEGARAGTSWILTLAAAQGSIWAKTSPGPWCRSWGQGLGGVLRWEEASGLPVRPQEPLVCCQAPSWATHPVVETWEGSGGLGSIPARAEPHESPEFSQAWTSARWKPHFIFGLVGAFTLSFFFVWCFAFISFPSCFLRGWNGTRAGVQRLALPTAAGARKEPVVMQRGQCPAPG